MAQVEHPRNLPGKSELTVRNSLALDGKLKTDLPFETYVLNIVFKNAGPQSYITRNLHKDFCTGKSINV